MVTPARRLRGELRVPGDKSISHRALMISSIGEGPCTIQGVSGGEDVMATRDALAALGVVISNTNPLVETQKLSTRDSDSQILVNGLGWAGLKRARAPIFCQNSGTSARTLLGLLAGRPFESTIDGDASLRSRPMGRVVDPLRAMGAEISGAEGADRLPLLVRGGTLSGVTYRSPVASAQVKTAVLFAGMQATGETVFREPQLSRDHTERLLEYLGVPIARSSDQLIIKSTNIRNASSLSIPGDLSSAAFLLVAAALLPGSELRIVDVGLNPTRSGILDVLEAFGAEVTIEAREEKSGEPRGSVFVRARDRRPVEISGPNVVRTVDELPLVAVLGAFADGDTVIRDAAELHVKESDRIATLAEGLRGLGVEVDTLPDGMVVHGAAPLRGGKVSSGGDHRIAMALAVAALAAQGETAISGWDSVAVSYPSFLDDLESVTER